MSTAFRITRATIQIRQRMHDLVRAQYSTDPVEVQRFIQRTVSPTG